MGCQAAQTSAGIKGAGGRNFRQPHLFTHRAGSTGIRQLEEEFSGSCRINAGLEFRGDDATGMESRAAAPRRT